MYHNKHWQFIVMLFSFFHFFGWGRGGYFLLAEENSQLKHWQALASTMLLGLPCFLDNLWIQKNQSIRWPKFSSCTSNGGIRLQTPGYSSTIQKNNCTSCVCVPHISTEWKIVFFTFHQLPLKTAFPLFLSLLLYCFTFQHRTVVDKEE